MKTRKLFEIELLGNVRYLSNVKSYKINNKEINREFELPNGIFNKVVPNCGGTTVALECGYKYVIASPRKELLYNKHRQNPTQLFWLSVVYLQMQLKTTSVKPINLKYWLPMTAFIKWLGQ